MKVYKSEGRFEKKKHRLKKGPTNYKLAEQTPQELKELPSMTQTPKMLPQTEAIEGKTIQMRWFEQRLPEGFWANHITLHMQEQRQSV